MTQQFTMADVRATYKPRDAWWTVVMVDPLAGRLTLFLANRTSITPNVLTSLAAVMGLGAAWSFWVGGTAGWLIGAILFHLSFVVDCCDGKIARLKGTGSPFGVWLDFLFDRIRDVLCAIGLLGGLAHSTGETYYYYLAIAFIAINLFRYLDASTVAKVRRGMNETIAEAAVSRGLDPSRWITSAPGDDDDDPSADDTKLAPSTPALSSEALSHDAAGLHPSFGRLERLRRTLLRHRIRIHLFSGIEYQMFLFVVAPILQIWWSSAVAVFTIVGGILLLSFEALLVYRMYSASKKLPTVLAKIDAAANVH